MLKKWINEDIIIYKDYIIIHAYKRIIDINNEEIKIQGIIIKGNNLMIKELNKDLIIVAGKIKEISFIED